MNTSLVGTAVAVIATLAMTSVGFSWFFVRTWGRPKQRITPDTPEDHGLRSEPVTFPSDSGELTGWFIGQDDPHASAVVVSHGWGSDGARMLPLAAMLHDNGHAVLLYDARRHGANTSQDPATLLSFAEDVSAAINYLSHRPDVDPNHLGIVGHSMGGSAAIVAASRNPKIRVVVAGSAFAHPVSLTRRVLRHLHIPRWPFLWLIRFFIERHLGTTMSDIAPQNRIADISVPVLLVHGAQDGVVPLSDMDLLYEAANHDHVRRLVLPERGHRDVLKDAEFARHALQFLNETLTPFNPEPTSIAETQSSGVFADPAT